MAWTAQKLNNLKNHFALTDKQIGTAIQERTFMVWKMRNGVIDLAKYESRLSGYLKALKAAKRAEMDAMADFFLSFED
ncbi:MAG TPA: hypothetical protein VKU83_11550 [Puia sp.]|nr:hypothetical protein [Puia sp.]